MAAVPQVPYGQKFYMIYVQMEKKNFIPRVNFENIKSDIQKWHRWVELGGGEVRDLKMRFILSLTQLLTECVQYHWCYTLKYCHISMQHAQIWHHDELKSRFVFVVFVIFLGSVSRTFRQCFSAFKATWALFSGISGRSHWTWSKLFNFSSFCGNISSCS